MAALADKSLSDFTRDAALSPTLDSAKVEFYQSINEDLLELKEKQLCID